MKTAAGVAIAAAVGTAAIMAYSSMKPHTKNELKKDFRKTFNHMDGVKEELGNGAPRYDADGENLKKRNVILYKGFYGKVYGRP